MTANAFALTSVRGDLPLRGVAIRARVVGYTADVELEHAFENTFDEALEVSYVFPLPDLAAVTRCELHVGDRVVAARLAERGAARDDYEAAVAAGRQAALAEQERPDVFTITLGNLAPGDRATVRFGFAYLLPREDGRHVLRLPLVVGERYVPGTPLAGDDLGDGVAPDTTAVPDASRVSPPRLVPGAPAPALAIEVTLAHGALELGELDCNLAVREERGETATVVRLAPGHRLDRDFVLRFQIGDDVVRTQLATCPDGDEGTFQLALLPPVAKLRTRPRDLVLLLDRSGSMEGWKIVAARRALARMVDVLDDGDRFAVYAFGSETVACADLPVDRLLAATAANRVRAVEMLSGLTAAGGTEMLHPLELATSLLAAEDGDRDRWIVLVTDGQVANEDALVTLASRGGAKILALGIDDAVNSSLLRRLAAATGGRVEVVQQTSDLEDALDRLHVLIAVPVVDHVAVDADAIVPGTLVPAGPLHVFPGVPLIVRGRYRAPLEAVRVRGRIGPEPFEQVVRAERVDVPALRACWAREHLLALEDRFAAAAPEAREALCGDLVATSLRHGVLSRFTAFVAVDTDAPPRPVATRHVQQPVEPTLVRFAPRAQVEVTRWGGTTGSARNARTMSGVLRGKFGYLSPEQARGYPIEPAHEVFGLAHLLCELVTAQWRFRGRDDFDTLQQIVNPVPPALPPAVAYLDAPVRRALAPAPRDRFSTPGAFADALVAAAPAIATRAEVAAYVAALDPASLARDATRLARAAAARPPRDGYYLIEQIACTSEATVYVAARDGHPPVVYARLHDHLAEDPDVVEHFLAHAAVEVPGLARVVEVGSDRLGAIFRATEYVHGLELHRILHALVRAKSPMPAPIALAIIVAAARALEAALDLPVPAGQPAAGLVLRDLAPSSLRVAVTGEPVWTSLGLAPAPHFTAPRRAGVAIAAAPSVAGLTADRGAPPLPPRASRLVVVPRRPAAPRPRRRWLRWWRE